MAQRFTKDPQAVLDYTINWSDWLDGDTISTSTWTAESGITVEASPAPSFTTTTTTIWLSGGTLGTVYRITNHVVTAATREDDRTFTVKIETK
jgi:hypothetical protein